MHSPIKVAVMLKLQLCHGVIFKDGVSGKRGHHWTSGRYKYPLETFRGGSWVFLKEEWFADAYWGID